MNTIGMDMPGKNAPAEAQGPYSLLAGAYALGLMISPDSLALLGRITGHFGYYTFLLIAGTLVLYLIYARSYAQIYHNHNPMGTWFAFYPLIVRMLAAVVVATGLTVSSGFVFNEVFAYWFPNFAFAFIMLGLVGVLHFLGPAARARAQIIFLGAAISGLVLLTAIGLARGPFLATLPNLSDHAIALPWLFLPLLLFVGFDMGLPSGQHSARAARDDGNGRKNRHRPVRAFNHLVVHRHGAACPRRKAHVHQHRPHDCRSGTFQVKPGASSWAWWSSSAPLPL